jgi:DHA2 family multidrug resistance protein-like MFS transporter
MSLVPEETAGVGAAIHEMAFQIGSVLGIAVLGAILNRVYLNDVASLATQLPPDIMASISNSIFSAHKVLDGSADLIQVVDNAFVNGLRYVFAFSTAIFSVLAILVRVYMPRNIQQAESSMPEIRDM